MPIIVAPVLIPVAAFLLCLLLWAMSQAGQAVLQPLLQRIAGWLTSIPVVGGHIAAGIDSAVHWVVSRIAAGALAIEQPVVAWFLHVASIVEGFGFSVYYLAERTYHALDVLRNHTIPGLLRALEAQALGVGHGAVKAVRSLERELGRDVAGLRKEAAAIAAAASAALIHAERSLRHAIAAELPAAIPGLRRGLREVERGESALRRRLTHVERLVAAGVGAAIIARLLARLGVPRCNNGHLTKTASKVCGMDPSLLEDLLGGLTLILGTISLVEFAKQCQSVEDDVAAAVRVFVRVT